MYLGFVLREARNEARSGKPAFLARQSFPLQCGRPHETKLMNFVGRHVRGGTRVDVILVTFLAIAKRGDRQSSAAVGRVVGARKVAKIYKREKLHCEWRR